jgi:DNA-binding response OmpR family regulator
MAKILVVDDEEHIVMILKDSLEFSGFQVITAYNGQEALDRVEADHPDLIVLDIGMPKLDGWEVCRRLKSYEKTKQIPIIILTAYAQTSDQRKGMQLGADRFVTKPCDLTYLVEEINALLSEKTKNQ